ncbi:MAG: DUF6474 family protein [Pseudonocardia sp.]|nr:DUF6474 family protein [Pseudonocardia sp.]
MGLFRRSRTERMAVVDPDGADPDEVERTTESRSGRRAARKQQKAAAAEVAGATKATREPMTAKRAKRLLGVGKVVVPVVAPYALAAASTARTAWDNRRAARLGVAPDQLGAYAGPGGALHARVSRVADTLATLADGSGDTSGFVGQTRPRLADLSVAVRAAEQMPAHRRRAAYKAIGHELDTVESALLDRLGVPTT